MARQKQPDLHEANLSYQQIRTALPKLDRRIQDLRDFDINSVIDRNDPRINAMQQKLDTLLVSVFGASTVEYQRYERDVKHSEPENLHISGSRNGQLKFRLVHQTTN